MSVSGEPTPTSMTMARHDPILAARVISRTPLLYRAGGDASLDRPPHVRAASSLALVGDRLVITQDDANFIGVVRTGGADVDAIALPAGPEGKRQFDDVRGTKHLKLDLEASVAVVEEARTTLYAFGSGARPERERIAVVTGWESGMTEVAMVETPRLYAMLRGTPAFAGSELNLEGAAIVAGELWLFGRGNGARRGDVAPLNATCVLDWAGVRAHLRAPLTAGVPTPRRITRYELGTLGTTPLGFTDAIAVGDDLLYSAAAEASPDAASDGPVAGSCIGMIAADGAVRWAPLVDATGAVFAGKVEGIAFDSGARDRLTAVLDHDDPAIPSDLCVIALEGPWFGPARPAS
jgi:hypothetical protein